jgi:hypothetical protein
MLNSNTNILFKKLNAEGQGEMTSWSSIMEKTSTFPNETIHITPSALCISMAIGIKWCPSWNPLYLQILTMVLSFAVAPIGQLMTLITSIFRVGSITITSTTNTWSSRVMWKLTCNEIPNVRAYHCSFNTMCSLYRMRAYMIFLWRHVWLSIDFRTDNVLDVC